MFSNFLDAWYDFFESWTFLERVINSRFSFLYYLFPEHLLHHIGTLLLLSVPCFFLTIILFHKRVKAVPWVPFLSGACVGLSLVLMWLFTSESWTEIVVVLKQIGGLFLSVFTSFGIGSIVGLLIGLPFALFNLLMVLAIFCLPFIPMAAAVYFDYITYKAWLPVALIGDLGMGTLAIAAIVAGFFAMGIFILIYVGPLMLFFIGIGSIRIRL